MPVRKAITGEGAERPEFGCCNSTRQGWIVCKGRGRGARVSGQGFLEASQVVSEVVRARSPALPFLL